MASTFWGDAETYRQYLRKFADDYASSVVTMHAVLANNQPSVAAALAHKMKGSAANLALLDVSQKAAMIERELTAGAYYYLTKPLQPKLLLTVVKAALADRHAFIEGQAAVRQAGKALDFLESGVFRCRTANDARDLAYGLARGFPDPERVVLGLQELLLNAVEHGNLGITYEEKTRLMIEGTWADEIERRLSLPEFLDHTVAATFARDETALTVTIEDMGGLRLAQIHGIRPRTRFRPSWPRHCDVPHAELRLARVSGQRQYRSREGGPTCLGRVARIHEPVSITVTPTSIFEAYDVQISHPGDLNELARGGLATVRGLHCLLFSDSYPCTNGLLPTISTDRCGTHRLIIRCHAYKSPRYSGIASPQVKFSTSENE